MAILVGIDEAGYGPVLGPLVVSAAAFEIPDELLDRSLWELLSATVTPRISKRHARLPILDSKKLYQRSEGLGPLERTALVMATVADVPNESLRKLLMAVAPHRLPDLADYPWYRDFDLDLPLANDRTAIVMQANAVRHDLRRTGLRLIGLFVEPLVEGHFNRQVADTRNKAVVSMGLVLRLVHRVAQATAQKNLRICVDRQGGRQHYRSVLATAFQCAHVDVLRETPEQSAYCFETGGRSLHFEFTVEGETHDLPVALAGIISKYVRELFMAGLNRFWADRVTDLKSTAGYYQDAQRFLADIDESLRRQHIERRLLVRAR